MHHGHALREMGRRKPPRRDRTKFREPNGLPAESRTAPSARSTRFISGQPWKHWHPNKSTLQPSRYHCKNNCVDAFAPLHVMSGQWGTTRARTGRKGRKHRLKSVKRVTRAHTHPTLPNPTQLDPPGVFLPLLSNAIRLAPPIACDPTFTCCCPAPDPAAAALVAALEKQLHPDPAAWHSKGIVGLQETETSSRRSGLPGVPACRTAIEAASHSRGGNLDLRAPAVGYGVACSSAAGRAGAACRRRRATAGEGRKAGREAAVGSTRTRWSSRARPWEGGACYPFQVAWGRERVRDWQRCGGGICWKPGPPIGGRPIIRGSMPAEEDALHGARETAKSLRDPG